jgi:hypothetical protein
MFISKRRRMSALDRCRVVARSAVRGAILSTAGLLVPLAGCGGPTVAELKADLEDKDAQLEQKDKQIETARENLARTREQLLQARGLDPQRWERAFRPVDVRIATRSGGADYDGKPGDDGVTVYLQPIDRDGDVVKVAGEIRIQLYDLAAPAGRQLIGEYRVPAEECHKHWYGKLMTQHFTIKCPWPSAPPQHSTITIRATFVDDLTGNVMTTQEAVEAALPSAGGRVSRATPQAAQRIPA